MSHRGGKSSAGKPDARRLHGEQGREAFAKDLHAERSLVAVTAKSNRSKGRKDPAKWLPPSQGAVCTYLVDWTATKLRWGLSADETSATPSSALRRTARLHGHVRARALTRT
ncbi:hypothetical protein ABZV41_34820 [Streptomyces sp. NPDC005098]|uniref:hypothetical protein n=1 Tax=Streptomyces sp. NPDC005098 TaxID=3154560 RepID=UPI0033A13AFB